MTSTILRLVLLVVVATFGAKVFAHARIKVTGALVPRSNDAGIKTGPCGGLPRLAQPATYAPGSTITVTWEETINHPGRYEFYFSPANDQNFQLLATINDNQDGGGLPHQYTANITLPNVQCNACTLQMIQVMTENPAAPSLYFSCADIRLQAGAPTPTPVPGPTPAPSPGPAPNCKTH